MSDDETISMHGWCADSSLRSWCTSLTRSRAHETRCRGGYTPTTALASSTESSRRR